MLQQAHEQRGDRLAVLAIPADLGVADFCAFLGGYLRAVREHGPTYSCALPTRQPWGSFPVLTLEARPSFALTALPAICPAQATL